MDVLKNIILNNVNKVCPQKYRSKYSHSYYLDFMIYVLRDITSWNFIIFNYDCRNDNHN